MTRPVARTQVIRQLHDLGVPRGSVVLVHTSFRETGPVEGGPEGLIEALIEAVGDDGTLVMPSWTGSDDEPFDRTSTPCDHLGVVADAFWRRPGVVRGDHPFAVAAFGARADEIAGVPFVLPPHAPPSGIGRVHDLDGWVLLLGVDHDADTMIHLAELVAGVPYRQANYITIVEDGTPKRIIYGENDSCCRGFNLVGDWLDARGLQRTGRVGRGKAMLARSRDIVSTVCEELADDPCRFLCPKWTGCDECDEAWASVVESVR